MGCKVCKLGNNGEVHGDDSARDGGSGSSVPGSSALQSQQPHVRHSEAVVNMLIRTRRKPGFLNESMDAYMNDIQLLNEDGLAEMEQRPEKGSENDGSIGTKKPQKIVPKRAEDIKIIHDALNSHVLFSGLSEEDLARLQDTMEIVTVKDGEEVFRQGDQGDKFYIVRSGVFEILIDDKIEMMSTTRMVFGEMALLYDCPRHATVRAIKRALNKQAMKEKPTLFSLTGKDFRQLLARSAAVRHQFTVEALQNVPLLRNLTSEQMNLMLLSAHTLKFREGDTIIQKGDMGQIFYMIERGSVVCTNIGEVDSSSLCDVTLHQGDYFGERALLLDEPRAATVIAKTDVAVIVIDRETFTSILGPLRALLEENSILRGLQTVPLLSTLSLSSKVELVKKVRTKVFQINEHIITEAKYGDEFFIIKSGTARVLKIVDAKNPSTALEQLAILQAGDYFGELALLKSAPRNATVVAQTLTECYVISKEEFDSVLGPLQDLIAWKGGNREKEADEAVFVASFKLEDVEVIAILGTGTFGVVKLIRHTLTNRHLAMKEMVKAKIEKNSQKSHVKWEKDVGIHLKHPFINGLLMAKSDAKKLYFFSEPLLGGELFARIINKNGQPTPLSMAAARFYSGCILLALEYMHEDCIAYRDLKPENVVLDSTGYAHLVDFGFAKKITKRSYTLCGTPEYLAPEMVMGSGHGVQVDYWALGVLIYEMVVGDSPFCDAGNDEMMVCSNIVRNQVKYPPKCDPAWQEIVSFFLQSKPDRRLGNIKTGSKSVKGHAWYATLDWVDLERRRMVAPWKPALLHPYDTSEFPVPDPSVLKEFKSWEAVDPTTSWEEF